MWRLALVQMVVIVDCFVMAKTGEEAVAVSLKPARVAGNHQHPRCRQTYWEERNSQAKPAICKQSWQHMVCKLSMSDGSVVEFDVKFDFCETSRDVLKSHGNVDVLPWGLAVKVRRDHPEKDPNGVEHAFLYDSFERRMPNYSATI